MPAQQVLILAMTKMLSGICTAGFTPEPAPTTGLRWVRPVRPFGTLLPGDMTDDHGALVCCCDVVELNLLEPRPSPPHVEDWLTDFIHCRPRVLRHLEGEKRARFLAQHLDQSPREVLTQHRRSLCLVQPRQVWAHFALDTYSSRYQARLGFALADDTCSLWTTGPRGLPVTDLKWRALGRSWLDERGGDLELDHDTLVRRLNARAIYLALGLSRNWRGAYWLLVVGVHVVPDYTAAVEIECAQ